MIDIYVKNHKLWGEGGLIKLLLRKKGGLLNFGQFCLVEVRWEKKLYLNSHYKWQVQKIKMGPLLFMKKHQFFIYSWEIMYFFFKSHSIPCPTLYVNLSPFFSFIIFLDLIYMFIWLDDQNIQRNSKLELWKKCKPRTLPRLYILKLLEKIHCFSWKVNRKKSTWILYSSFMNKMSI